MSLDLKKLIDKILTHINTLNSNITSLSNNINSVNTTLTNNINNVNNIKVNKSGDTMTGELINSSGGIWIQGGSAAGGDINRFSFTAGMPSAFPYNGNKRGVKFYSNAIALADPLNSNSNNDAGWLRHIEETANNGILELGVGDDGSESIVVRKYNTSSEPIAQAYLLDSSNNTSFPGTLSAGKYTANTNQSSEYQVSCRGGAGQIYLYSQAATTGSRGIYGCNAAGTGYNVMSVDQNNNVVIANSALASRRTIGGSSFAASLQAEFNSYKAQIPRNCVLPFYSSAYGNGSILFGYWLSGYDTNPYGGFYVCHYNTARYVGIQNGAYTEYVITKTAASSRRIKENIQPMTEIEANKLYQLNVISFDYKKGYENNAKNQLGLIAEECNKIIPNAVFKPGNEKDSIWSIDYTKFTPYLIKNLQIHEEKIKKLEEENNVLKSQLESLRQKKN